jgi:hypothetical protein
VNPNIDLNDVILGTIDRTQVRSMDRKFLAGLLGCGDLSDQVRSRIRLILDSTGPGDDDL